jgi:hypothetical protein
VETPKREVESFRVTPKQLAWTTKYRRGEKAIGALKKIYEARLAEAQQIRERLGMLTDEQMSLMDAAPIFSLYEIEGQDPVEDGMVPPAEGSNLAY